MAGLVRWARRRGRRRSAADFIGPGQVVAFDRCAAEQDNLVAAPALGGRARRRAGRRRHRRARCSTCGRARACTSRSSSWAMRAAARRRPGRAARSAILFAARRRGRPLPDADRLAWTCVFVGVNAGVAAVACGPSRWPGGRCGRVLAERPGEVSPADDARSPRRCPRSARPTSDQSLDAARPDGRAPGPVPAGARAVHARGGPGERRRPAGRRAATPSRRTAGSRPSATTGAWAWPRRAVGQWVSAARRRRTPTSGCAAACEHLELVGATQDVRSRSGCCWTCSSRWPATRRRARRLREVTASHAGRRVDAAQANLGLAQLAWQRGRYDEALAHAEAACRAGRRRCRGPAAAAGARHVPGRGGRHPPAGGRRRGRRRAPTAAVARAADAAVGSPATRRWPRQRHARARGVGARRRGAGGVPGRRRPRPRAVGARRCGSAPTSCCSSSWASANGSTAALGDEDEP